MKTHSDQVAYEVKDKFGREICVTFVDKETHEFYQDFFQKDIHLKEIKDWSDYVIIHNKICNEDGDTLYVRFNVTVYDKPVLGCGYMEVTDDNINEMSLDEFIQDRIVKFERRTYKNKNIKVTEINKIFK